MTRLDKFNALATHPWLGRLFAKLTSAELLWCRAYLVTTADKDRGEFEHLTNRLWLDRPDKPKHHKEMLELLICANSAKEET